MIIELFFESILKGQRELKVIIRLFQVFRASRLAKSFRSVAKMFRGLFFVIPKVAPTFSLLMLTIMIYALFGIQIYGLLREQSFLNDFDLHFRSFSSAMFTLTRIASGE